MDQLLRFSETVRRDPAIEAWFGKHADPFRLMVRPWFERMRGCGGDVPFAYVNAFKAHACVGFFMGASLSDPAGLLEGQGKRMRHVKLRPGQEAGQERDNTALSNLIVAAYNDVRQRLSADT